MATANTISDAADTKSIKQNAESSKSNSGSTSSGLSSPVKVIRRNGKLTGFDDSKISIAMTKAFLAIEGGTAAASARIHETVAILTKQVIDNLFRRLPDGGTIHIEDIQDQVELVMMRSGHHKAARAYVLYREERAKERAQRDSIDHTSTDSNLQTTWPDGNKRPLDIERLKRLIEFCCTGLDTVDPAKIMQEGLRNLYDGIPVKDVIQAFVMSTRVMIEHEPDYSYAAARLLLDALRQEAMTFLDQPTATTIDTFTQESYADYFQAYIRRGIELDLLDEKLAQYDLEALARAIQPERDIQFTYLGLQTLYDRYFIHHNDQRFEMPQAFFMRVAMGLAINEVDREARSIEFYNLLSSFDFMSSTPTLFNSGTQRPQLSSCYLTTVPDDLDGIYNAIKDNAMLSKFAGGLGNDWSPVRGLGAHIKGTNGKSQGVVPFLKVVNDTAVAVNQGGKRKGAVCAYLETWHIDIEEFLELRKNTGDERRRTHDMNTANWIPDLFLKRVNDQAAWTLFSPNETPELHDLSGLAFEKKYLDYEEKASRGEIKIFKTVDAVELWRKMLTMLFETGHPWVTFKDPCNLRYTNQHIGTVHSSNLCTEITLHTNESEIAVCNLGSINLVHHLTDEGIDHEKLRKTIHTAMRMLDNVIEYNYYSVDKARRSNLRNRPVGMGIMGFQDALYHLRIPYASMDAVEFADRSMESISYFAIEASSNLAAERGRYQTFDGSLWSQGILPIDSIDLLEKGRGGYLQIDRSQTLDWDSLREKVQTQGMRNSNVMAIAPTATISNICGVSQSIEPTYQNLYVKSNLSGEFTVVNPYLVTDLKKLGLWDDVMVNDLKYYDGSLQPIARVPKELKELYANAFEIDSRWLIEAASRRQKWIDQAQSINLYMAQPSGKALDNMYKLAWVRGLKTTYYLRSLGATHAGKATIPDENQTQVYTMEDTQSPEMLEEPTQGPKICSILDPDCEACQ